MKGHLPGAGAALGGALFWACISLHGLSKARRISVEEEGLRVWGWSGREASLPWEEISAVQRIRGVWTEDVRLIRVETPELSLRFSERLEGVHELLSTLAERCPHIDVARLPSGE